MATDNKSFSKTLLLPKTNFPLWVDPANTEKPFQARTTEDLYRWQWENAKGPLFVLHDGPPYANGDLHMGHALNKILKDIITRYHVSRGRRVHYIPGWDCHGLPIENKALKAIGKSALEVPPRTIREAADQTAVDAVLKQKEQFQNFGIMADWSKESTYRTLDHGYEMRQLRLFQKMVENDLIYRHYRPVHYSPSSHSALAEAELVYKEDHVSHSVYVTFELDVDKAEFATNLLPEPIHLLVWTTTPWTLTANMGIAVSKDIKYVVVRGESGLVVVAEDCLDSLKDILGSTEVVASLEGSELVGCTYRPIFSSLLPQQTASLPIVFAPHVTSKSGTGLVHCAPAHGAEDYIAFKSQGLLSSMRPIVCHVDRMGAFSSDVATVVGADAAQTLLGQPVLEAGSRAIVQLLKNMNALVKIKRFKHKYPYDWRTDKPIIVTATSQWFANLDDIKDDALQVLGDIEFFPAASRTRLESFIRTRSEWCISRQRVWGVPIPALYRLDTDEAVLDAESLTHILKVLDEKGVSYWWDGPVEEFVPPSLRDDRPASEVWRKGTDTMDVWFDSGSSWTMLQDLEQGTGRKFLADVCLEGSDQHRGWFQSQLLTSVSFASGLEKENVPGAYGALITHGMVLDEAGRKMSKSLGNVIDPLVIVNGGADKKKQPAYGADLLRLWTATVDYWNDMSIGPKVLSQTAESMRRLRNSARFMLGNIGVSDTHVPVERSQMGLAERYVMNELYNLEQTALSGYDAYNFHKVMTALINFSNTTLSSQYFDITKDCLYANSVESVERRAVVTVLQHILRTTTSILAPVLPHLAEEIHTARHGTESSVFKTPWVPLGPEWQDPQAAEDMNQLLNIRGTVLSLLEEARGKKLVKSSLEAEVDLIQAGDAEGMEGIINLLEREEDFLKTLFIVSNVSLLDEGSLGTSSPDWIYTGSVPVQGSDDELGVRVRPPTREKCPRCWTFTRRKELDLCQRCSHVVAH